MDEANNYMSNNNGKLVKSQQQQQQELGFVKERTFSSDHHPIQWPRRNYFCNFCTREFKCAQALGGHMNVHRRDRARLRLLHISNCYPNFSPSCFTFRSNVNNSLFSIDEEKKASIGSCSWNMASTQDDEVLDDDHVLKKKKKKIVVNLEGCSNEDLDLELHL